MCVEEPVRRLHSAQYIVSQYIYYDNRNYSSIFHCLQKYMFHWQLQWLLNSFLAFHVINTFIKNIYSSICITFLHTEIEEDLA